MQAHASVEYGEVDVRERYIRGDAHIVSVKLWGEAKDESIKHALFRAHYNQHISERFRRNDFVAVKFFEACLIATAGRRNERRIVGSEQILHCHSIKKL